MSYKLYANGVTNRTSAVRNPFRSHLQRTAGLNDVRTRGTYINKHRSLNDCYM